MCTHVHYDISSPGLYHVLDEVPGGGLDHVGGLQGHTDDHPIAGSQPQPVTRDVESRDADEGEAKLTRACNQEDDEGSRNNFTWDDNY